jgi:Protein of unknown function (DUF3768)
VDPGFGTGGVVGAEPFCRLDGAEHDEDETEDRCGAEGEDCLGGAARAGDGCGPGTTLSRDPYGERDFGGFEHQGEKIFWKIDYYDKSMKKGSEDPSDRGQTVRVLMG